MTRTRKLKTLARLAGAGLVAAPLAAGALGAGLAHASNTPALARLIPTQQISGYARTPYAVAVSGNTAVVGSIGDNAAYVFVKTSSGWVQQARLADPDSANAASDEFGYAVTISGNTVLVGDPAHVANDCNATPNQQTGAVFEFDRSGTTWKAMGSLGCSYSGDKLGASVAFDGTDAVLGAPGYQQNTGRAYLLREITPGDWQQQQVLMAGEGQPGDAFGTAVSISGSEALVGAPNATIATKQNGDTVVPHSGAGAAYAFVATGKSVKSGDAWAEQARLIAPVPTTGAAFGAAVSINGKMALIGAPFDKNGAQAGATYLATLNATGIWGMPVALATPAAASQFGGSVSLGTAAGQTLAVVGDYGADTAFVFNQSGASFTQGATLRQQGALGFGSAVATDGTTAVVGAIYGNNYQGSAYIAQIGATPPTTVTPPTETPPPPARAVTMTINDTDPRIVYSGSGWGYYPGRPASFTDVDNDVHATLTNGSSVSYTFSGSSISYISERSAGYGKVDVYIDGRYRATVDANSATAHNMGGQVLYRKSGLRLGRHTITLVKRSGVYMLLDAFRVS